MTSEQFCYWLQGFSEITQSAPMEHEWKIIRAHLDLVFKKETPAFDVKPVYGPKIDPNRWWAIPPVITC